MRRTWWIYLIGVLGLVAVAAPFLWMVLGSFKTQGELLRVPPTWWPENADHRELRRPVQQGELPALLPQLGRSSRWSSRPGT